MDESPASSKEPPSRRTQRGGVTRRGRPSQDDYVRQVCTVLRYDAFRLEECTTLGQLPAVQALARRMQRSIFPTGSALHTLLDRAVTEVEMLARNQRDLNSVRIAIFLEMWYRQGEPVTLVADALELSRSHVAHHIQKRALELVARRFLELAGRVEVPA
jgi:hypothetical protein